MNRPSLLLALLTLPLASLAEEDHVQLSTHVHGITTLEIARDANELELALISPAYNLVGFEHQPGDEAQKKQVSEVMTLLKSPERFLSLDSKAACELHEVEVETGLAGEHEANAMADHVHEQHQEHEHKHEAERQAQAHEGEAHSHSDIHARYHFQCVNPQALTALEIDLFSHFPLIEVIHAQIITRSSQRELELTPGTTRIPLAD